jgi:cation diffusion facilitator family transporter
MMTVEIIAGMAFGSMALLADGWHMGTHAVALGITLFAYKYASKHAKNPRYTFGTGKISVLGGFTSAVILQVVALLMAGEAVQRLFNPRPIQFGEAISVAALGLIINLISVRLLGEHEHSHGHLHAGEQHDHHHGTDHNLKAAYLHVLADALTSVLAILALLAGWLWGWIWMDAVMGIVGSILISRWAIGLLKDTSHILLDGRSNEEIVQEIHSLLESDADNRISDLHVWQIGEDASAAIIAVVTHYPRPVEHYRKLLEPVHELRHITIEVNVCTEPPCLPVSYPAI